MKTLRSLGVVLALAASPLLADTYTVTSTGDSGAGTLRQAITDANGHAGADTIAFAIPGAGVHTITPLTVLPNVTEAVTIDGYSQPGSSANTHPLSQGTNAVLLIEIDCEMMPLSTACLTVAASDVTIRGLVVNRDTESDAIAQTSGDNLVLAGNFVGTTPDGRAQASGSQIRGIRLNSGSGHVVGGPNPADRNLISGIHDAGGLSGDGLLIQGSASATIQGNFIGLDASGSSQVPNANGIKIGTSGVVHLGGSGAGEGNVVSGNNNMGIYGDAPATGFGNLIGTDVTGTRGLPNRSVGWVVGGGAGAQIGGLGAGEGNVIAFNGGGLGHVGGLNITSGTGIAVRGNSIYENVDRGIAFNGNSPTPNDLGDGDSGPNGNQNYPMLTAVDYGATTTVHAKLNSKASTTYDIDFYANAACPDRPPLYAQGRTYVGTTQATTDASGNVDIAFTLPVVLQSGQPVTMVATDPSGSSSEFSQSIALVTLARSGSAAGGLDVPIIGQQFEATPAVNFGGTPAASVTFTNDQILHATTPVLSPGSVNDVQVVNPSGAVGVLDNAFIADFTDVPNSNNFYNDVVTLVANEITVGVGGGNYGVAQNIKRQSMSVFILKAEHGKCYTPPPCNGLFDDVPCPSTFAPWIEQMAAEGITGGCGGGDFCPDSPVRRDQMAVFLLKGKHGSAYVPPSCAGVFTDVACPSTFANWIEQLKAEGVTSGCGGTNYCPSSSNSRGQMATFISKTFLLK